MKATGIVRRIDALGRICLPKEFETTMGTGAGIPMEIYIQDNMIILKKYQPICGVCKESNDLVPFLEKHGIEICKKCLAEAKK